MLPKDVTSGSSKKVWWVCKNGHEWQSSIASRNSGHGCSKCKKFKIRSDGAICDSLIESYFYIEFQKEKMDFLHNGKYFDNMNIEFDFYFPQTKTYIEVTSFNRKRNYGFKHYWNYLKNIARKKKLVEGIGRKFKFIQKNLSRAERRKLYRLVEKTSPKY